MKSRNHAPDGWHSVTPRIVCADTVGLLEFLKSVFDAQGTYEPDRPTVVLIGDSPIMLSTTDVREINRSFLYVYVESADEIFELAMAAGGTSIEAPTDTHYGDRRCMFDDPWGNSWQVANR